jgi:ABC-3C protein
MKYAYEDLSDEQFEQVVLFICQRLLGVGVQGFAKGRDGGRDAKFVGTAELHPSRAEPWRGTTIVQAKHTNGYNRHFAEHDFYNPESDKTVLGEELPRIRRLRDSKELDHYMLFSNRRLAGGIETEIRSHIAKSCNIPAAAIYLCGVEQLEVWLKTFPDIPEKVSLDPVDSPLIVSPDDLAVVVQLLAQSKEELSKVIDDPPTPRVSYEKKNEINCMSTEYARAQRKKYLKDTAQIQAFLAAPENIELQRLYESVTDEFQLKIISKRKDYQSFDRVMEYLVDLLFKRDPILRQRQHKRITRAVLFYMYWNCDIGEVAIDAAAD